MSTALVQPSRRALIATISAGVGATLAAPALLGSAQAATSHAAVNLMNVSYDPTRTLYRSINSAFAAQWKARTGQAISITQSHGASFHQQALVESGLPADVVTLAHPVRGLSRHAPRPAPYASTVAFLVRAGNPSAILDWSDLMRSDVEVVTPSPRSSAAGRWTYLSAWSDAAAAGGDSHADRAVDRLYRKVSVLDTSTLAASNTFIADGVGDVLVTWENEAKKLALEADADLVEVVYPSSAVLMQPALSLVDRNVERHRSAAMAQAYLDFLYTKEAEAMIAAAHLRTTATAPHQEGPATLRTLADLGGWDAVNARHFSKA